MPGMEVSGGFTLPDVRRAIGIENQLQYNATDSASYDNTGQPNLTETNYWPEFGTLQYFELAYILCLIVVGSLGNLIVIFSIVLEKKVHSSGNIFIINLAIADFMICTITLPSMAANIVVCGNALNKLLCDIVGYIVTTTAACSLFNLALVAVNRYWAVVKSTSYRRFFSKRIGIGLAILAWVWSLLMISPTIFGWASLTFDAKSLVCAWLDTASLSYSIFLMCTAIVLPLGVIAFSYYKIFSTVRASGRWRRALSSNCQMGEKHRHQLQRERSLIYTLMATVIAFCVCWTPYAIHVFIDPGNTTPHLKKFLVWLALTNSSINWIIYGTLNPAFKRGYRKLFYFVFRCFDDELASGRNRSVWSSGHTGDRSANAMGGVKVNSIYKKKGFRYSAPSEILKRSPATNTDALICSDGTHREPEKKRVPFNRRLKFMFSRNTKPVT